MRLDEDERMAGRWLDVKQAAEELGISSDAVRKRIARGTLRAGKKEDGSVRVWLDSEDDRRDGDQPEGWTEAGHRLDGRLDAILEAKDEALRDLRDQLEHMRRESERKDAIIMQMAQANATLSARVPELEPAPEPREEPETASPKMEGVETPIAEEKPVSSWWRRMFGSA
jgi:predicted nuclease with TOPRIM domain